MSTVCFYNGYIFSDQEPSFKKGAVLCDDGVISAVSFEEGARFEADEYVDLEGKYLTPGFTDAHTHGRSGYDFEAANESEMEVMLTSYASRGVTSVFPTIASAPFDVILRQGDRINSLKDSKKKMAHVAGVHLEGRYLNAAKRGAHATELITAPDKNDVSDIVEHLSLPLHVSAAFELDYDDAFASALTNAGATLGLAHSTANYATALSLYEKYGISLTHMFNAMPPLHHRDGGAVCAGLLTDMYTEIICDGIHVSPEMIALSYKCKGNDKLVLISDSMSATDSPDGEYLLAGQTVIVKDSIARTLDGALAGSTLNFEKAINNLVAFSSADIPSAIKCASANPCKMLGIFDKYGSITTGKSADLIVASIENGVFAIESVYVSAGA